jgi:hypothetical protein
MTPRAAASVLVLLAAPVSGLQAPGALRVHRGDSFAVASAPRGAALAMQAGDDSAAVESKRSRFLRPLRSASTSVAATVLLALVGPRGAARAAEPMQAPTHSATTNSRSVENVAAPFTLRTLSPRRGTIDQMEEDLAESRQNAPADTAQLPRDMEDLLGRGAHRQYMKRDFLFGEELTALTPLQEELDELDEYTSQGDGLVGKFKGVFTIAGTGALMCAASLDGWRPSPNPRRWTRARRTRRTRRTRRPVRWQVRDAARAAAGREGLHHQREEGDAGGDGPDWHVYRHRRGRGRGRGRPEDRQEHHGGRRRQAAQGERPGHRRAG